MQYEKPQIERNERIIPLVVDGSFKLEVDVKRGVLYLHRADGELAGSTALRVCQIDPRYFYSGWERSLLDIVAAEFPGNP